MATIHHDVRMVSQQASPVCWLACAAMILQYKRGYTPSPQQLGFMDDFRTPRYTVPAIAGWDGHLRRLGFKVGTSREVRNRELSRRMPTMAPSTRGAAAEELTDTEELIYWILRNKGPFILSHFSGSFWYGPSVQMPPPGSAHAVVVTGLETTAPRSRVYFNNPWGQKDVPTTTSSIEGALQGYERSSGLSIAYLD